MKQNIGSMLLTAMCWCWACSAAAYDDAFCTWPSCLFKKCCGVYGRANDIINSSAALLCGSGLGCAHAYIVDHTIAAAAWLLCQYA